MNDYCVFHQTVRGYNHTKRGISCEDASACYAGEGKSGNYYIAAVADGHGDRACIRSAKGAGLAAKTALECLKSFAQAALDGQAGGWEMGVMEQLSHARYQEELVRQLSDALVAQWNDKVQAHIREYPFQEAELAQADRAADSYRAGKNLVHAYGTTLIAALLLPGYLLLLQQGDGRCDVFYADGTVDQPIPWDDRCYQNVTTSMCDPDAACGIRACIVPLEQKEAIACYLGSDGVEDSYRNMEGTHMFYRELSCMLADWAGNHGTHAGSCLDAGVLRKNLKGVLKGLSRYGSGDDVSVAGIVDIGALRQKVPLFQRQVYAHGLKEEQIQYESRRISMSRKHGILRARMEDAEKILDEKKSEEEAAQQRYAQAKREFEDYDAQFQKIEEGIRRVTEDLDALEESSRQEK